MPHLVLIKILTYYKNNCVLVIKLRVNSKSTLPPTFMSFCTLPPELKKVVRGYMYSTKSALCPFPAISSESYACKPPKYQ